MPGQAAGLYRAAERSGRRALRPAAAPAENPDAGIDISARFYVFTRHEPATPPLSAAFIHLLQTLQTG
ncbi:hypothetical protein IC615_07365 [Serratia ureilytica]